MVQKLVPHLKRFAAYIEPKAKPYVEYLNYVAEQAKVGAVMTACDIATQLFRYIQYIIDSVQNCGDTVSVFEFSFISRFSRQLRILEHFTLQIAVNNAQISGNHNRLHEFSAKEILLRAELYNL